MDQPITIPAYLLPLPFLAFLFFFLLSFRRPVIAVPSAVSYGGLLEKVAQDVRRTLAPPGLYEPQVEALIAKLVPGIITRHLGDNLDAPVRAIATEVVSVAVAAVAARLDALTEQSARLGGQAALHAAGGEGAAAGAAPPGDTPAATPAAAAPPGVFLRVLAWLFLALGIGLTGDGIVLGHMRLLGQVSEWTGCLAAAAAAGVSFAAAFGCWERHQTHVRRESNPELTRDWR